MGLDFHPVGLDDAATMRRLFEEDPPEISDFAFGYEFAYSRSANLKGVFATVAGCGIFGWNENNSPSFSAPFGGGDKRAAVEALEMHCRENARPLVMTDVPAAAAKEIPQFLSRPCTVEPDRDEFDYLYRRDELVALKGGIHVNHRRLIHRFEKGGEWSYEPVSAANLDECREVLAAWRREKVVLPEQNFRILDDSTAVEAVLSGYFDLGLVGGVLRQRGRAVGFAIGERLNATTMVQSFERELRSVPGAGAMLGREFVRVDCAGYEFVNRTCDVGDPGLRRVKTGYGPCRMVEKFTITAEAE
ncbi:MAG: DUF2156 domain-containing protein [Kiritimatiellae bacterium]|nr:DUF2156 domain-containing protein [Kiritimatiellia bacterium]